MPQDKTLKPCPFCGQTPDVNNTNTFDTNQVTKWGFVVCCCNGPEVRTGCGTLEDWKQKAIDAWNTRATPPTPEGMRSVEECQDAAQALWNEIQKADYETANRDDIPDDYCHKIRALFTRVSEVIDEVRLPQSAHNRAIASQSEKLRKMREALEDAERSLMQGNTAAPLQVIRQALANIRKVGTVIEVHSPSGICGYEIDGSATPFGKRSNPPCGDCDEDGFCTMNCGPASYPERKTPHDN